MNATARLLDHLRPLIDFRLRDLGLTQSMAVVECGCESNRHTFRITARAAESGSVPAVERPEPGAQLARRRID